MKIPLQKLKKEEDRIKNKKIKIEQNGFSQKLFMILQFKEFSL